MSTSSQSSEDLTGESLSSSGSAESSISVPTKYTTEYREEAELGDTYAKEEAENILGLPKRKDSVAGRDW